VQSSRRIRGKIAADPDTVRGADVAFVRSHELHRIPRRGFAELAPDLVAQVLSPDDRPGEVLAKVAEWLGAGTSLVWVIDPQRTEARVYRAAFTWRSPWAMRSTGSIRLGLAKAVAIRTNPEISRRLRQ